MLFLGAFEGIGPDVLNDKQAPNDLEHCVHTGQRRIDAEPSRIVVDAPIDIRIQRFQFRFEIGIDGKQGLLCQFSESGLAYEIELCAAPDYQVELDRSLTGAS